MKKLLLTLWILLVSMIGYSQTGNLNGLVQTSDNQPAMFVTIRLVSYPLGTTTDENGRYIFKNVPLGSQKFIFSSVGFQSSEKEINILSGENKFDLQLDFDSKELGAVEVLGQKRRTSSATKTDIELIDIPMSIQVVGQELILSQAIIDMKDVVKNVSGVNQTGSYNGGYQYFNSRGFDMNNWTNFRRNGTLLWNMGNHFADFYESIEFLKGPSSILYGDVAPGGIMNFVTKKPLTYNYGRFDLKVGQYGLFRPSLDLGGPLNKKGNLLYRLNATYEQSNSFRNLVENQTVMFAPAMTWRISPETTWTLEGTYKNEERIGDPGLVSPDGTFEGLKRISERTFLGEPEGTYNYNNSSYFSTFTHYFGKNWKFQNLTSFNKTIRTPQNIYVNNDADENGNVTRYQYFFKQSFDTWTTVFDLSGEFATGGIIHKTLIGVDFVDDRIRGLGFLEEPIPGTINLFNPVQGQAELAPLIEERDNFGSYYTRVGVYAQDQMSLFQNRLQVLLGLRYNYYENGFRYDNPEDQPSDEKPVVERPLIPRFGVVYKPAERLSVYGSYSESFEVNGFDWIRLDFMVPPTFGKQAEVGVKGDFFDQKLGVTLAAFNINKENVYGWGYSETEPTDFEFVSWTPEYGGYFTYLAPKHRSRGFELDINGKLFDNLKLIGSASYIHTEVVEDPAFESGNWLVNQPRIMFNIWGDYKFKGALKNFDLGYGVFYKGMFYASLDNDPDGKVPANYTMDVAAGYNFGKFRTQLNVTNLTNRINYLGSFGTWEPQWTRRAILSLSYRF